MAKLSILIQFLYTKPLTNFYVCGIVLFVKLIATYEPLKTTRDGRESQRNSVPETWQPPRPQARWQPASRDGRPTWTIPPTARQVSPRTRLANFPKGRARNDRARITSEQTAMRWRRRRRQSTLASGTARVPTSRRGLPKARVPQGYREFPRVGGEIGTRSRTRAGNMEGASRDVPGILLLGVRATLAPCGRHVTQPIARRLHVAHPS